MNFNYTGIEGFDVSTYQDIPTTPQVIDFAKMKAWGVDFVIIRAGQNKWIDSDFVISWEAARIAGLPRAAYWFYDPRVSPLTQAKIFTDLVRNDPPEGRLWIDLEFPTSWGGTFTGWMHWKAMIEETKRLSGLPVGVYTANWWWSQQAIGDYAYFGQYPLWVAQYTNSAADVTLPKGWTKAIIWQDGTPAIGREVGVESVEVDHNKFNGYAADFIREFGNVPSTPPVTPPIGETMTTGTTSQQVKAYNVPNASTLQNGVVGANVTFNIIERQGDWLRHQDGRWVNVMKNGVVVITVTGTVTPPPPPTTTTWPDKITAHIGAETKDYFPHV